ncbi:MAG: universal stress protein [Eggerthellaceae bacterium]|jgi:nucleotide-binding universal stress UspA family protein
MKNILVGFDGSDRGERALAWAAQEANEQSARLTVLTVLDSKVIREAGAEEEEARKSVAAMQDEAARKVAEKFPFVTCDKRIVSGKVVDALVDEADENDIVVLGTHHGRSIGQTISGAKGLRVSISTMVPTVVVPADWDPERKGSGIVVAVSPDDSSDNAIAFGVEYALCHKEPLKLVSAWGVPAYLSRPAEVMGGELYRVGENFQANLDARIATIKSAHPELEVTGEAVEGSSPTKVLLEYCKDCELLVMGTHSRTALGRTVFGSVTHSVLLNLVVPTVVVSQQGGARQD